MKTEKGIGEVVVIGVLALVVSLVVASAVQGPTKARGERPPRLEDFSGVLSVDARAQAPAGATIVVLKKGETSRRFVVQIESVEGRDATVVTQEKKPVESARDELSLEGRRASVKYVPADAGEPYPIASIDLGPRPEHGSPVKGLLVDDLEVGQGPTVARGNTVVVHYMGWLKDGMKRFENSRDRGVPLTFRLGERAVILGWDRGIPGMRVGGKRRLTISPELAYGSQGSGRSIPPNATLVFEIELLRVQ